MSVPASFSESFPDDSENIVTKAEDALALRQYALAVELSSRCLLLSGGAGPVPCWIGAFALDVPRRAPAASFQPLHVSLVPATGSFDRAAGVLIQAHFREETWPEWDGSYGSAQVPAALEVVTLYLWFCLHATTGARWGDSAHAAGNLLRYLFERCEKVPCGEELKDDVVDVMMMFFAEILPFLDFGEDWRTKLRAWLVGAGLVSSSSAEDFFCDGAPSSECGYGPKKYPNPLVADEIIARLADYVSVEGGGFLHKCVSECIPMMYEWRKTMENGVSSNAGPASCLSGPGSGRSVDGAPSGPEMDRSRVAPAGGIRRILLDPLWDGKRRWENRVMVAVASQQGSPSGAACPGSRGGEGGGGGEEVSG
eukprot:CAMPEP_0194319120 /NCGR_PEP_ID=MMETSP0171-20130528/15615_1 /TAXON_ID=218684 /ORGANISM="Corethron pennatum, Strain L29A3" /LENGTH=366 /DNA_ID=CAMNT_0039076227 /DNA_START=39 /DNA_END=1140 /DNA_ORIENTATION=-